MEPARLLLDIMQSFWSSNLSFILLPLCQEQGIQAYYYKVVGTLTVLTQYDLVGEGHLLTP